MKKMKSVFMGMCASIIVMAMVGFFNTALKPYIDSAIAQQASPKVSLTPIVGISATPTVLGESVSSQSGEVVRVKRVVDGDTVELENGEKLRYIGIDTPESKKPNTPVQCFALAAAARNKELVEGKEVRLVKDHSDRDRFQRLLRYVYVGDVLINKQLIEEGYAFSSAYSPDTSLQDYFNEAQARARASNTGLWGSCTVTQKTNGKYTTN